MWWLPYVTWDEYILSHGTICLCPIQRSTYISCNDLETSYVTQSLNPMGRFLIIPWDVIYFSMGRFKIIPWDDSWIIPCDDFYLCRIILSTKIKSYTKKIIPWEDIFFQMGRFLVIQWDVFGSPHGMIFTCVGLSYTTKNHPMGRFQFITWDGKKSHGLKWWFQIIPSWDGRFWTQFRPMGRLKSERMIFDRPMGWLCPCDVIVMLEIRISLDIIESELHSTQSELIKIIWNIRVESTIHVLTKNLYQFVFVLHTVSVLCVCTTCQINK